MSALRYTLLADGSSDRCLIGIINWLLTGIPAVATRGFIPQMAELRHLPDPPKTLADRISQTIRQFPCDILFVHRDAEAQPREKRIQEIDDAVARVVTLPHVPIVPVRMTEAWLLLEEDSIRKAADNPNGTIHLGLPPTANLERIPDPKKVLEGLLILAAEKSGRRKDQFERDISVRRQRVAELIRDFSPLRQLPAFRALEADLNAAIEKCAAGN
jgi:hypothetical protein